MSKIDVLKRQRADLDRKIKAMAVQHEQQAKDELLKADYFKAACPSCSGQGILHSMGSDNMDIDERGCEDCGGNGFLYARKWVGPQDHDMRHNQVCAP